MERNPHHHVPGIAQASRQQDHQGGGDHRVGARRAPRQLHRRRGEKQEITKAGNQGVEGPIFPIQGGPERFQDEQPDPAAVGQTGERAEAEQAAEAEPAVIRHRQEHAGEKDRGEMHDGGRNERAHRAEIFLVEEARPDRRRDEHEPHQRRRRLADEHVEIAPVVKGFGERGGHGDSQDEGATRRPGTAADHVHNFFMATFPALASPPNGVRPEIASPPGA